MTDDEKTARLLELAGTIAYANSLGVRAAVVGDVAQRAEAERIHREAMEEVGRLRGATSEQTAAGEPKP
jgi:hypothetical protein